VHVIDIRKTVSLVEEIKSEYGSHTNPALQRVAIALLPPRCHVCEPAPFVQEGMPLLQFTSKKVCP
jgi:hypothetical protein